MLPLELEKIIIEYSDPKIYGYMYSLNPKNYTYVEYQKFIISQSQYYATKIESEYKTNFDRFMIELNSLVFLREFIYLETSRQSIFNKIKILKRIICDKIVAIFREWDLTPPDKYLKSDISKN